MRKSNLRATAAWQALALFGAGVIATPAMAQDAPPASGETSPPAEEQPALSPEGQAGAADEAIIVTGSRLVRPELDAPSPVTTVDSETFDLTGTVTVETLLNELPQLIPGNTRTSNNQGGEDFSTLDLRGIGPNRTLILVDGERVPASSTTGVVDIGTIPAGLIERVDVVTGGASAVYGSDAMAGVVNFVLKDNYEGMELTGQYGISDHGDGSQFNIQGLLGGNFADDRGNLTFFSSYYTRDVVGQGDRNVTRNAGVLYYDYTGNPEDLFYFVPDHLQPTSDFAQPGHFIGIVPGGSGTPPWGWITNNAIGAGPDRIYGTADDTGNPFGGGAIGNDCGDDGICGVDADGPDNILGTDDDDYWDDTPVYADNGLGSVLPGQFGAGTIDTNCDGIPNASFFRTGNLSFNDQGLLEPRNTAGLCAFADRSTGSSRYNFNPVNYLQTPYKRWNMALTGRYDISDAIRFKIVANYTDSEQEVSLAPTPVTGLVIDPTLNPFIQLGGSTPSGWAPCGVGVSCHPDLLAALNSRPDPDAPFTMDRRWFETGPRIGVYDSKTATIRGTLSGPLAHGFNWDVTASYGRTDATSTAYGNTARSATLQGLAGCPTGSIVGCIPLDIFGPGTLFFEGYLNEGDTSSPFINAGDMVSYSSLTTKETRFFDQARIAGNITGNIVDLPAGPVGVAIGAEVRTDRGDIVVDDAQRRGDMYGFNATQDQHGKVNVKEIYGEVRIPVLADMPFVHEFSIEAGARYSDYSSVGGLFNWKLGAQFAPVEWLKIRGIFNKAARAPSIVELFQNGDQGFPSYTDFCRFTASDPDILEACQAQVVLAGGPANFNFAGFVQNNTQVEAFAFGSTELSEETANTFTLGAVLTPNLGLGRFSATVDYYSIDIKDYVSAIGASTIFGSCRNAITADGAAALTDPATFCDRIFRDPVTGQVDHINTSVANAGRLKVSGIDVGLNYAVPFSDLGIGIGGRLRVQELLSWLDKYDFNDTDFAGTGGGGIGGNLPEWKSTLTVAYDSDDFTAQMRWNWQSDLEDINAFSCNPGDNCAPDVPGLSYFDLSLRKSIGDNFELTGIVQNLFNQKAKKTVSGYSAEGGVDAAYWNPVILGRYFTIQGKVKF